MNKREREAQFRMIEALRTLGISFDDIDVLRRASRTLQRWFELECGNSDTHSSWCIVRGWKPIAQKRPAHAFEHDDGGSPFMERITHRGTGKTTYAPIPDREKGARKRIAKILAKHPELGSYVQTDPRGCALHILRPGDVPPGEDASSYYTRGIAVY